MPATDLRLPRLRTNQIPNAITSVRLAAAIGLICSAVANNQHYFLPLVLTAGISDMLDGMVARKFKWCTEFGAHLDSISDLLIYLSVILFLILRQPQAMSQCSWALSLGIVLQSVHIIYALKKHGSFPAYHSKFSQLSAYVIYIGIMTFWIFKISFVLSVLALLWAACSMEGLVITAILKNRQINVASIGAALKRIAVTSQ